MKHTTHRQLGSGCRQTPCHDTLRSRRQRISTHATGSAASLHGPVLILPGFLSAAAAYGGMAKELEECGHQAEVLPVSLRTWLPVVAGGSCLQYLLLLRTAVTHLHENTGRPVSLVGVSAGGWIARLALGSQCYDGVTFNLAASGMVDTLLTLGTPHKSLELYPFGRALERRRGEASDLPEEAQRSSLQFANHCYPDAASLAPVRVVCVVGSTIRGKQETLRQALQALVTRKRTLAELNSATLASISYQANCGHVDGVDGDGICPIETAMLPGAEKAVLSGIWHTPSSDGRLWYGSPAAIDQWHKYLH